MKASAIAISRTVAPDEVWAEINAADHSDL
jgi:hypothetical protein